MGGIPGKPIKIQRSPQTGQIAVDMISGASLDARCNSGTQVSIPIVPGDRVKRGKTLGLLRPADIRGREMVGIKCIGHRLRVKAWRDPDQEISQPSWPS